MTNKREKAQNITDIMQQIQQKKVTTWQILKEDS